MSLIGEDRHTLVARRVYCIARQNVLVPEGARGADHQTGVPVFTNLFAHVELRAVVRISRKAWRAVRQVVAQRAFLYVKSKSKTVTNDTRFAATRIVPSVLP